MQVTNGRTNGHNENNTRCSILMFRKLKCIISCWQVYLIGFIGYRKHTTLARRLLRSRVWTISSADCCGLLVASIRARGRKVSRHTVGPSRGNGNANGISPVYLLDTLVVNIWWTYYRRDHSGQYSRWVSRPQPAPEPTWNSNGNSDVYAYDDPGDKNR